MSSPGITNFGSLKYDYEFRMAKTIASLKSGMMDEKIGVLDIQIVKKISEVSYIVADKKDHIVLVSDQSLQTGSAYRLIKPSYSELILRKNSKFAAVKMENTITTKPLKKEDEEILCANITAGEKSINNTSKNDFGSVDSLGVGGIVDEIKLMVVKKSSVIQGKFGNYRIVTCKDIKNQKNHLNLYRNLVDMVDNGEIYKVTKLKVSNYKREDDDFNRLGTTISSRIIKGSATDKKEFDEAKVRVGDHIVKGTIIGISELNIYQSCKVCWCKVDDEGFCRKCDKKVDNTKPDFNLVMYVQSDDQDDDIIEIFSFNTTLDLKLEKDTDVSEDNLNKMMMEMKVTAEYDVDKTRDDGKFKLVKFHMFSSK